MIRQTIDAENDEEEPLLTRYAPKMNTTHGDVFLGDTPSTIHPFLGDTPPTTPPFLGEAPPTMPTAEGLVIRVYATSKSTYVKYF